MQTHFFKHFFLIVMMLVLYTAPTFAGAPITSWDDLRPGGDIEFDDPLAQLSPEQLRDLRAIVRIRWLIANHKSEPDGVSAKEEQRLVKHLADRGIDVEWLLSQREKIAGQRRQKLESAGSGVVDTVIRIPGYVMPLFPEQPEVRDFLLVPWVAPCAHFPPPPANQVIHVTIAPGMVPRDRFDPVWIEGALNRKPSEHTLFLVDGVSRIEADYSLEGKYIADYSAQESDALNHTAMPTQYSVHSWFMNIQMRVANLFTRAMIAIRDRHSSAPVWIGLSITFAYGALHTLGPGHGKAVVISYFVGQGGSVKRGIRMGAQIAICHVLSAVVVVWLTNVIIRQATGQAPSDFRSIRLVSYAAITAIGLFLLWRALREALPKAGGHAHDAGICSVEEHAGHHAGCACASHSAQQAGPVGWLALAVGAVPCTGAILVLLFGISNDLLGPAILMVMAMSLGMAIAMSGIGIAAILGRNYAYRRFIRHDALRVRVARGLRVTSAALIAAIGLSLFSLTMLEERSMPLTASAEASSSLSSEKTPSETESKIHTF